MTPLEDLRDTLVRQHALRLPSGLGPDAADRLVAGLSRGEALDALAGAVGLDPRVAGAVTRAGVHDVPGTLVALGDTLNRFTVASRTLRAAGTYALVLAVSVGVAGVAAGSFAMPALAVVPGGPVSGFALMRGAVLAVGALLVLLCLVVLTRAPIPGVGWALVECAAVSSALASLTAAGAPLPAALRGAAVWTRGARRAALVRLAVDLDAGQAVSVDRGLDVALLAGAAAHGTVPATAAAIAAQRRVQLDRLLPVRVLRIQIVGLLLAGLGLAAVASAFYWEYARVFG